MIYWGHVLDSQIYINISLIQIIAVDIFKYIYLRNIRLQLNYHNFSFFEHSCLVLYALFSDEEHFLFIPPHIMLGIRG